jgi:hypothetical protein
MGVYVSDLYRDICTPGLKLDFTAHGIMESLPKFGHRVSDADPDLVFHINADPDLVFHINADPDPAPAPR